MSTVQALILVVWSTRILANILSYIRLWSIKEYRWDRMWIHLKTRQGKRIFFPPWRVPPFTPKTLVLTVTSIGLLGALFLSLPGSTVVRLLVMDLVSFPAIALLVAGVNMPVGLYHQTQKGRAIRRLRARKNLLTVGITGSYGKTSTKEFLAAILSTKYRVLKTYASQNSPIGIAEAVLSHLAEDHEIFVAEMGAYKRGEIKEMAAMVKPQIGIITGINTQHLELFGSLENTMKAKYELVAGLTGKRIAVINFDNPYTQKMAARARRDGVTVWPYGTSGFFWVKDTEVRATELRFTAGYKKESFKIRVPLLGGHQVENILAAIAAAVACGMTFREAASAAHGLRPFPKTMEPIAGINGALFVNDTFNNNPDGALAAIAYLSRTPGKKILVFQPMIELGAASGSSHEEIGESAGKVADDILLTNRNFYESFVAGVKRAGAVEKVRILPPARAAAYIRSRVKKGDTVLFKGKEAEAVLRHSSMLTR